MENSELEEVLRYLEASDAADYQAGVLLLQRHCRNRALVAHLLRKDSPGNREKLRYELVKVGCEGRVEDVGEVLSHFAQAVQAAVEPVADVAAAVADFRQQAKPEQVPEAVRPEVDKLTEAMGQAYNRRVQLSNSLADLDPAAAPPVVSEILALQDTYNALAQKRRALVEGGEVPAPVETPASDAPMAMDRAELLQRRGNLRSSISKTRGKLEKAQTEDKRSELSQKLAKLEVELTDVDLQLKQFQA